MATTGENEIETILKEKWTDSSRPGYISAKGCILPDLYLKFQQDIDEFEVFDDDIWICSFPKTGTTWMSEMVWLIANDLDYEKAKIKTSQRIRFLDKSFLVSSNEVEDPIIYVKDQPRPRFIKTHLPFQLLPKQIQNKQKHPNVVYICRNPLDTCVSYYYFAKGLQFSGNLEEFCKLFLAEKVMYGPFWGNVSSFWQVKEEPNVLFLRYEEMKENLQDVIKKTARFLGKALSDGQIEKLQNHLSFESMKHNPAVNSVIDNVPVKPGHTRTPFIRSGTVGNYKTELPQEFIRIFQKWLRENIERTGIPF